MNHHSPPKFYIERFTNESGQVIGVNINTLKYFQTNPKNVCAYSNLYRIGDNDHSYEKHLSGLDGMLSKNYPEANEKYISIENIAAVLSLMARIFAYSPNSIKQSQLFMVDFYRQHPEFRSHQQLYELKNIHSKMFVYYAEIMKQYSYLPITTTNQEKFITSDNPVVHFCSIDKSEYFIFPIDSTNVLIGTACPLLFTIKDAITPPFINSLLVHKADRHVYMPDYECEVDVGGYNMSFNEIINKELSLVNLNRLWYNYYFKPIDVQHDSILLSNDILSDIFRESESN